MRVLLTGSTGRLGGAFLSLWQNPTDCPHEVVALTREDVDLSKPEDLRWALERMPSEIDVIVNPAAVSGLEECLDHPELAQAVNVDSPRVMAEYCAKKGIQLVHFSTDYVFGGDGEGRKSENDETGAVNVYGASKREGELAVLGACPNALVCRVSWLFGPASPHRLSHFDHVLNRALAGEAQCLIGDKYSVPTFTYDIVRWVEVLLGNKRSGVYHLCNSGEPESWMSYAKKVCLLAQDYGYDAANAELIETSMKEATFFRERRPRHTAMLPARMLGEGLVSPRHWIEAAKEYLKIR
jgi:dTDP-4-dehydrorhamnose reductase